MPANSADPILNSNTALQSAGLSFFHRRSFQAAVLCLAAFITSAAVALNVFEAMPHLEDEHANYFQAQVFARGEIAAPAPLSRDSFFVAFVIVRDGLWFAKYTPGFPLALALGFLLGAPWFTNALASALALFGVFLLGRDIYGADAGLLAAALGAVSPAFVILSGTFLPHPVTMAALVFFAWAFLRARRAGEPRAPLFAILSGAALGLAVLCRPWTAFAVALPFIAIALADVFRAVMGRGRSAPRPENGPLASYGRGRMAMRPYSGRNALRPYVPLVMVCIAVCALLPLYNYIVTGSPFTNTYTLWWPYDTVGFGPGAGFEGGHTLLLGLVNARKDLSAFQTALLGWPAPLGIPLAALPLILGLLLAPRRRADWLLLLPPLALVAAHLAYWARSGDFFGGRYYSEGMAFLWLLAARGLLKIPTGKWMTVAVRAALPVLLAWGVFFQILPRFAGGHGLYGTSRETVAASGAAGLHNALVFINIHAWKDLANFSWLNSPFLDDDVIFARDMGGRANTQIIDAFPGREIYYYTPGGTLTPADGAE